MDPMMNLLAASFTGAAAFSGAGYWWGRAREIAKPRSRQAERSLIDQLHTLESELERARTEAEAARHHAKQVQAATFATPPPTVDPELLRLQQEVARLAQERDVTALENTRLKSTASASADSERLRLQQEVARLKQERDAHTNENARLKSTVATLQEHAHELTARLAEVEVQLPHPAAPAYDHERTQRMQRELESAHERIAALQRDLADLEPTRAQVLELTQENRSLKAAEFAHRAKRPLVPPTVPRGIESADGDVLQQLVERIESLADVQRAVVADQLGLVVAGRGDFADELAAAAGQMMDSGARMARVLPIDTPASCTLVDRHGTAVIIRTLPATESPLNLAVLGLDEARIEELSHIIQSTPRVGL